MADRLFVGGMAWAVAVVTLLLVCTGASAAVKVTSTADDGAGDCTLREAIEAANEHAGTAGCPGVEPSGYETTIEVPANSYLLEKQLEVKAGAYIKIVGTGSGYAVIDGANKDRVMEVASGATLTLENVEITGGHSHNAKVPESVYQAYPADNGGGILNRGALTLRHSLVTQNETGHGARGLNSTAPKVNAGPGSEGGSGGGIFNYGSLSIYDSTVSKNRTGDGGNGGDGGQGEVPEIGHNPQGLDGGRGGVAGDGGGIYNAGSLYIVNSTISGNETGRGGNGGGGGQGAGALNMFGAGRGGDGGEGGNSGYQYQKNTGYADDLERGGGGIFNGGTLEMVDSTIAKNNTGAGGNGGSSGPGGKRENGTFETSGRAGIGGGAGRGGGLLSGGASHTPVHLTNVTIYGNFTGDGGTGGGGGGGADSTLGGGAGGYGGDGGGLFTQGPSSAGSEVVLAQVTIAGNGVGAAGLAGASARPDFGAPGVRGMGAGVAVGGRYNPGGQSVYMKNSIIAANGNPAFGDTNCHTKYAPEQYVDFFDQGNNVTFPAGGSANAICPGTVGNPAFGLFGDHGGPTETIVPSGTGIGIVPAAACTVHEDQRGEPRPAVGKTTCDAGAVETTLTGPVVAEPPVAETPVGGGSPPVGVGAVVVGGGTPGGGGAAGQGHASAGAPKVTGTSVSVPITCSGGQSCSVKVVLAVAVSGKASGSSLAGRPKATKRLTVGVASASIAAGATKPVSVSLNGRGKQLLGKSHKLKTTLTVTLSGSTRPLLNRAVTFTGKG